jgi:predicted N-acyltransferase
MRKTFLLRPEGKHPDRVLEAVKHEIRKYLKRERRRALPEGVDFWDFDCKVGPDAAQAAVVHVAELIGAVDALAKDANAQAYVEILAKHGRRQRRPHSDQADQEAGEGTESAS